MKTRGSYEHMLEVISKKPRLKEVFDNIDKYTDEEIDKNADIPSWIKKHLKRTTIIEQQKVDISAAESVVDMLYDKYPRKGPTVFDYYHYNGMDTVVSGFSAMENDPLAVIRPGMMKIGNHSVIVKPHEMAALLSNSTHLGKTDIYGYGQYTQEAISKRHALGSMDIMPVTRDYSMAGIMAGVRIG